MNRAFAVVAAAALAVGCNQKKDITAEEARTAVQSQDGVQISAPGATAPTSMGASEYSVAGTSSEYKRVTRALAATFNGAVVWSLGIVKLVVAFPPTSCKDDTCTWGPWAAGPLAPAEWKLTVTKVADGEFDYAFSAHLRSQPSAPFVPVLYGTAFPKSRLVGHGSFTVDLEAGRAFDDANTDTGRLDVTWSNESDIQVGATFTGCTDKSNGHRSDAKYAYSQSATQGDLQLAVRDNSATPAPATLQLHSRWMMDTGAGRGDAYFDQGVVSYDASECWSGFADGFQVVYWSSNSPALPPSGSESACAFAPAAPPTLQLPPLP